MSALMNTMTLAALLGSALMAGVFFAFSTFVMKALSKLPADAGVAAMQQINLVVINPWFLGAFIGTAVVSLALAVLSVLRWSTPGSGWVLAGALLYLVGTFGVTVLFNVPLNNALAPLQPGASGLADRWSHYLTVWTGWNHVRTVAPLLATGSLAWGLRLMACSG